MSEREELAKMVMQLNAEQFQEVLIGMTIIKTLDHDRAKAAIELFKEGVPIRGVARRFGVTIDEGGDQ